MVLSADHPAPLSVTRAVQLRADTVVEQGHLAGRVEHVVSGQATDFEALETEVLAFDKPVVLVHGDTHYFRVDQPLFSTTRKRLIEHFTRVETFGSPNVHWVRVIVDPSDPQVFTFKPEIVQKNLIKHGSQ